MINFISSGTQNGMCDHWTEECIEDVKLRKKKITHLEGTILDGTMPVGDFKEIYKEKEVFVAHLRVIKTSSSTEEVQLGLIESKLEVFQGKVCELEELRDQLLFFTNFCADLDCGKFD